MKNTSKLMQKHFIDNMCSTGMLFESNATGRTLWQTYLNAFSDEMDPQFRDPESSSHNCNLCNNFIKRYGNIVAIGEDGNIITIFDVIPEKEYINSFKAMRKLLLKESILNVFFESFSELNALNYDKVKKTDDIFKLGFFKNVKRYTKAEAEAFPGGILIKPNEVRTFHHFNLELPKKFILTGNDSVAKIQGEYRTNRDVFKRGLTEISLDTLQLVRDLINQNSLLDGTAHLDVLKVYIDEKNKYEMCKDSKTIENWFWVHTYNMSERLAKFRNTLIGVLCVELTEGMELNKACSNWNKRVDPVNYHKASAPITKKQIAEAQKYVEDNGLTESFDRRLATIDDIKVDEIMHVNVGDGEVKTASVFDSVKASPTQHKRAEHKGVQEITIEKFMKDILPECTGVEALLENRYENNLAVLTTSKTETSKNIFKWNNNYSHTFNGNLAGKSQIKETVKGAGGSVTGDLRFSIMWAEGDGDDSDLDAHCKFKGFHIHYGNMKHPKSGGNLDLDVTRPSRQMPKGAVENITFPNKSTMDDGEYKFIVNQYASRQSKGFKAEIEFNGEIFEYSYPKPVSGQNLVAIVTLKDGEFTIEHTLECSTASKLMWGLESKAFHKVNLMCLSPNHWGTNAVGNKYYFFMLDKCKAIHSMRGFHNENLNAELLKHRKVTEVLGATNMISPTAKHLAGLGFNSTVKDELIVKCTGSFKRMLKITF